MKFVNDFKINTTIAASPTGNNQQIDVVEDCGLTYSNGKLGTVTASNTRKGVITADRYKQVSDALTRLDNLANNAATVAYVDGKFASYTPSTNVDSGDVSASFIKKNGTTWTDTNVTGRGITLTGTYGIRIGTTRFYLGAGTNADKLLNVDTDGTPFFDVAPANHTHNEYYNTSGGDITGNVNIKRSLTVDENITVKGKVTSQNGFFESSDKKLKENIESISDIDKIKNIELKEFNFIKRQRENKEVRCDCTRNRRSRS